MGETFVVVHKDGSKFLVGCHEKNGTTEWTRRSDWAHVFYSYAKAVEYVATYGLQPTTRIIPYHNMIF